MSDERPFSGTVVRIEADGFGIVQLDRQLGTNTHAVFSTSISNSLPLKKLKAGVHVSGLVQVDRDRDLAAVRTLAVD